MEWISVKERTPDDSYGRVLCWIEEQSDLGKSSYFWNCSYSKLHGFTDSAIKGIITVTHWAEVKPPSES